MRSYAQDEAVELAHTSESPEAMKSVVMWVT